MVYPKIDLLRKFLCVYTRSYFLFFLLLSALFSSLLLFFVSPSEKERQAYFRTLKETEAQRKEKVLSKRPMEQERETVQKDLWTAQRGKRLHTRIASRRSSLTLSQKGGKIEAEEILEGIASLLQEEIDLGKNTQELRAFSSAKGLYLYPEHRFSAKQVDIAFYTAPGIELPSAEELSSPYLIGTASEVLFRATDKQPLLTAHHLRARFRTEDAL